jgi:FMN-dependent NADH-azoreductase
MKVLHVVASPRGLESTTLRVAQAYIESLRLHDPGLEVEVVDLYKTDLPAIAGENIETKYTLTLGQPIDRSHAESWKHIERLIEQFTSADAYVVSSPMWNLSVPYALKYYIDCIVQPGYTFRFDPSGVPVPLVLGKRMTCVTSRGADYSAASPMNAYDFQEPYLRAIFGYIGIYDLHFIHAQPVDIGLDLREAAIEKAIQQGHALAAS